jgi:hypothetical protein
LWGTNNQQTGAAVDVVGFSVGHNTALTVKCSAQYLCTGVKELEINESDLMKGWAWLSNSMRVWSHLSSLDKLWKVIIYGINMGDHERLKSQTLKIMNIWDFTVYLNWWDVGIVYWWNRINSKYTLSTACAHTKCKLSIGVTCNVCFRVLF